MLNKIRSLFTAQGQAATLAGINAILGVLVAFNVTLTQAQLGSITIAVNAVFGVLIVLFGTQVSDTAKSLRVPTK